MRRVSKSLIITVTILGLALICTACGGKGKSQKGKKNDTRAVPLLQLVKIGMISGEVEGIVGKPIRIWDASGYPLQFLSGIDKVWIYFNPFPEMLPRRAYLYFDIMDRVVAMDREGKGLADQADAGVRHFIVNAGDTQFYLRDIQDQENVDPALWDRELGERKMAMAGGIIGVGTGTDGYVPVTIAIRETRPAETDLNSWSLVNEASIVIPNGSLVVGGFNDEEAGRLPLASGSYRARIHYGGLETVTGGQSGRDYYFIALWPEAYSPAKVIKPGPG